MKKVALIIWVTGQDGVYLSELLLKKKEYIVYGLKKEASFFNPYRVDYLYHESHEEGKNFFLHNTDTTNSTILFA